MKVLFSERVEAAFERHLSFGVERFGKPVAERTFKRARRYLLDVLATYPRIGVYRAGRDVYEIVIPRTPFVAFYRIDAAAEVVTVVALFHYAQDRDSEWADRQ
jgi:plasmid stabilization system protein ParE